MAVIIQIGVQQAFGAAGSIFGVENAVITTANQAITLSQGLWMVRCAANTEVQYTPDAGTTFRIVIAAGAAGLVYSDGFNVRLLNTGVADTLNTYYTQIRAVPGI